MASKEGRKYEVTLPDGRVVSRQYASQLRNKEAFRKKQKEYYLANKERIAERQRNWNQSFIAKYGMTYMQKYYQDRKNKEVSSEDNIKE